MLENTSDFADLHWLLDTLQCIDVGVVGIDKQRHVQVWNGFVASHSGISPGAAKNSTIFELFPDQDLDWMRRTIDTVFQLGYKAYSSWEQRPYVFRFRSYRPITGTTDFMYQNASFIPISAPNGEISHIAIIIYDVTETVTNKLALETVNHQLTEFSRTDGLTQLFNRAHWEDRLKDEFQRFSRTKSTASLVIFDIDHFKKVNDTYGHQAGDEVIRETARILRETARATDICGRYGGEEFVAILIDTPANNALIFAERVRSRIEELTVTYDDIEIRFTVSLGISELNDTISTAHQWLEQSDQSLYLAKSSGRNCIKSFTDITTD
ncbi:MAG: diguanylate cyclase [Pseudomonadales bacterium]|nr:diguanylate cyclase [Pseudomonadales bacterium]